MQAGKDIRAHEQAKKKKKKNWAFSKNDYWKLEVTVSEAAATLGLMFPVLVQTCTVATAFTRHTHWAH
jgi:hypothetical protein